MLQRMGSGKQNGKLMRKETPRCKEKEREREEEDGRHEEENMSEGIE